MAREYKEVHPDDFTRFSKETPSYVLIEQTLIELGGGGNAAVNFKKDVLAAAGWKYGKLISYGAHPKTAAEAFNKIRDALMKGAGKDGLIQALSQ